MENGKCVAYKISNRAGVLKRFTFLLIRAATLKFETSKDCEEAFESSKNVTVNGDLLQVEYSTS